jgi:membrane protein DedA with SNARE-associated domain
MSTMNPLMIAAAPALALLGVAFASIIKISRHEASDRARFNVLRGLLWSFGVAVVAYSAAQAVLLAKSNFQSLTPAAGWPLVIFSIAAAATAWRIRRIQRQALVRH